MPQYRHTSDRCFFLSLLAFAVAIRIFYLIVLPHGQTVHFRLEGLNDEPSHYNYVKYLARHRSFPVQTMTVKDPDAMRISEFEYYQPPLYYLLCAPLRAIGGERAGLYLCRLLSLLFGVAGLAVLGKLFRHLGYPPSVAEAAVLFLAFLPSHAYFTSVVSNDSLCWLLSLLLTYRLIVHAGLSGNEALSRTGKRSGAMICLLLVAAMYTKSSTVIFFPLIATVYAYSWWRRRTAGIGVQGAVVLAAAVAALAPWHLRNLHLYHSLFALDLGFGAPSPAVRSLSDFLGLVKITIRFFWFPMLHLPADPLPVLALHYFGGAIVVACAGLTGLYFAVRRRICFGEAFLLLALALEGGAYLKLHLTWNNPEARFLFPALAGIVWLFAVPPAAYASRKGRRRGIAVALCLMALYPYAYLFFVNH